MLVRPNELPRVVLTMLFIIDTVNLPVRNWWPCGDVLRQRGKDV